MKRALQIASVASMIDLFNEDNIKILQEMGYEVEVAANFFEGSITSKERVNEYRKELEARNINVHHISIPRSIFKIKDIYKSYKVIKELAYSKKYDIMHCHSPIGSVVARLAFRGVRKNGTRVIYTAHGFHFFKGAKLANWIMFYPIERMCARYTDTIITINKEDYDRAGRFCAGQVQLVPGIGVDVEAIKGVSTEENRDKLREQYGFMKEDFVLVSVGQLSKRKNHGMVIEAIARMNNPKVKYLIIGFGELDSQLRKMVDRYNLNDRVIFAGFVKDAKSTLCAADCFVFPSLQEGLPVSLMEAMAAGLPCVVSNIRGNNELIDDRQCLFEPGDTEKLINILNKVMSDDELRRQMGVKNSMHITNYSVENVNCKMREIYLK